MLDQYFFLKIF